MSEKDKARSEAPESASANGELAEKRKGLRTRKAKMSEPSDEEMACSDARAHSGPGAQEQKVVVAHLPPTSTSSGGSFFSMQDHDDDIFEFESALTRRSFLEDCVTDWIFKRDLAKHRESSM